MIPTGIKKLDQFLGGGIKNGMITDIFGANGSGKTQLAMQISINSLLDGGQVLFQDTTGEFRPERMLEIIKAKKMNSNLLNKIKVSRITNTSEQIQDISKIRESNSFSLVIIDNISALFSFEYSKEEQTLEKNILFMRYMRDLSLTAIQNKIPIVITNVTRNIDNLVTENLEKSISMFTHLKIMLSKEGQKCKGEIFSPLEKYVFSYVISSAGLHDFS